MRLCAAAFFVCACAVFASEDGKDGNAKPDLTILFTGEAHAALLPCDCPLQPLGGVARRATLIKRYRERGPVLLVDAGGWAAGGIYDEDSDGDPERDNIRTELMAKAMAAMKYDMVSVSDAEYGYLKSQPAAGNFPFLGERVAKQLTEEPSSSGSVDGWEVLRLKDIISIEGEGSVPYLVRSFLRTARSKGRAAEPPSRFTYDPKKVVERFLNVILYAFGEDASEQLAEANPGHFDLIINAGRKKSNRVAWTVGNAVIANFDYQAQRLGVAECYARKGWKPGDPGPRWEIRVKHEPLTSEIPDDPEVARLLEPHLDALRKKTKKSVEIEVWTQPGCPYCLELWPVLEELGKELKDRAVFVPHFLVHKDAGGRLTGKADWLAELRVEAAIAKHYPERFVDWLRWRARPENAVAAWEDGAKALGLLPARLKGALEEGGEIDQALLADAELVPRRRVPGTPTLVIANRTYEGPNERLQILRALCGMLDEPKPTVCAGVPACFSDRDCRKRGVIGRCRDAGKPEAQCDQSQKAVPVAAAVLVEPGALWSNHERILPILLDYLPGLTWRFVDPEGEEGKALLEKYKIERLPAYLLDPAAKTEYQYAEMLKPIVREAGDRLVVAGSAVGAHRIVGRERIRGRADLFVARFAKEGQQAVDVALEALRWPQGVPQLEIHDALFWNEAPGPDGKPLHQFAAQNGIAEIDEAALALAVKEVAPKRYLDYLRLRGERRGRLFWRRTLEQAGLEAKAIERVAALANGPNDQPAAEILAQMRAVADLLKVLDAGGLVVLLGENCEIIPVASRADLRYYLERIGQRRAAPAPPASSGP